jgi:hypothetical protein
VPLQCPRCGLLNPESACRCDCGLELTALAQVCEKLVRLQIGSREVLVGTAPVSRVKPRSFATHRLRRPGDDLLVLWPAVYRRIALIPFIVGAATVSSHLLWSRDPPWVTAIHICLGALVLGLAVALWVLPRWFERLCLRALYRALGSGRSDLLPRRFEFDRAAGWVRVSWPDPWRERPLSDVLAIQLIKRPRPYRVGRHHGLKIGTAHELILVLEDAVRPRVSLASYPVWPPHPCPAGADAAALADFLGVALLDQARGSIERERISRSGGAG